MAKTAGSGIGAGLGRLGSMPRARKPIDLASFMEGNKPAAYELKQEKRKYEPMPANYQAPRYGRESLPIFYHNHTNSGLYQKVHLQYPD